MDKFFVAGYAENFSNALLLMVAGMVGIFVVLGILILVINVLNKTSKSEDEEE